MNTQIENTTTEKEGAVVTHTVFTAFSPEDNWEHQGLLYVRKLHEPTYQKAHFQREYMNATERQHMKETIPHIEDHMKSDWLRDVMDYGKRPILLTYKASENTLAQSGLFGCVLAKQTMHHTGTDADMRRVFDNATDKKLRTAWLEKGASRPLFIQLFDAYPEVYQVLKEQCDKKLVKLRYTEQKLTITIPHLNAEYILDVKTIRNDY